MILTPDPDHMTGYTRRDTGSFRYEVFGGVLHSDLPLPGLRPAPPSTRQPDWTFRVSVHSLESEGDVRLGTEHLVPGLDAELYSQPDGAYRLRYVGRGIGDFRVSADGRRIEWSPGDDPPVAHLRWILLGRVMSLALYRAGLLCLHASGVEAGEGVICFVGPKHYGKSTLAAACVAAGAVLVGDDVVPIECGTAVRARPGVATVRLWPDAVTRFATQCSPVDGKVAIDGWPDHRVMRSAAPLVAVYVLRPVARVLAPDEPARATPLSQLHAFKALTRHSTITPLLDARHSALMLSRAAAIAREVPVYNLEVVRDLDAAADVAAWLLARHGGPAARPDPLAPEVRCA